MTTALRKLDMAKTVSAWPRAEETHVADPAGVMSPRVTELLDWLNRDWDERSEEASCGPRGIKG